VLADEVGAHLGRMLVLGELTEGSHARVEVREGRLEVSPVHEPPKPAPPFDRAPSTSRIGESCRVSTGC